MFSRYQVRDFGRHASPTSARESRHSVGHTHAHTNYVHTVNTVGSGTRGQGTHSLRLGEVTQGCWK